MSVPNRLIREKSPYLLQHAHNPVDWYPWGEEAFEAARRQNKPVFLSIGYSTCHWCHVMAHESFESPDVAEILNANFISIKVDREERPDIDHIYMTAVSSMTGHGGWPLSAFLTPEKHPFFGGTYFPPFPRWGTPGFINVLESVLKAWNDQRDQIKESAAGIIEILSERAKQASQEMDLSTETLDQGFFQLGSRYDRAHGGFGQSPKFPSAHQLMFLMRYARKTGREEALRMSADTLLQMIKGGIYDHLGGGFHRYATDRQWQIPHFEKMLYDQAMISRSLLEAYQITKDDIFAEAARATLDYVLRDLTSSSGGFYSAEDADSVDPYDPDVHEKKEGAFYLWKQTEIIDVLGQDDAFVFNTHYQINQDGNAHSDPHGEFEGKNIIFTTESVQQTAERTGRSAEDVQSILQRSRKKLLDVRSQRQRPHLDDKILTDWNGLMIASLAFGARILKDERYWDAAVKAADFILTSMTRDSRLLHRWRDGEAGIQAGLDDYAFLVYGLIEMYQTSLEVRFLTQAKRLTNEMMVLFADSERGGFYLSSKHADDLPFRPKNVYDGAIPSGSSIAASNLLRLSRITSDMDYETAAQKMFQSCAADVQQVPMGHAQLLIGLMGMLGPCKEIVIASAPEGLSVDDVLDDLAFRFLPEAVIIGDSQSVFPSKELLNICPRADHHEPVGGQTTVYVCDRQSCQAPMTTLTGIDSLLS